MDLPPLMGILETALGDLGPFWALLSACCIIPTACSILSMGSLFSPNEVSLWLIALPVISACSYLTAPYHCTRSKGLRTDEDLAYRCYFTGSDDQAPDLVLLASVWFLSCIPAILLSGCLIRLAAHWRGELAPSKGIKCKTYEAVKKKGTKCAKVLAAVYDVDSKVIEAYDVRDAFEKDLFGTRGTAASVEDASYTNDEKTLHDWVDGGSLETGSQGLSEGALDWYPPQDVIELGYFAALTRTLPENRYDEWTDQMCRDYSIGGIGTGLTLSLSEMKRLAEEEAQRDDLQCAEGEGTLPRKWRSVCNALAAIWTPALVVRILLSIMCTLGPTSRTVSAKPLSKAHVMNLDVCASSNSTIATTFLSELGSAYIVGDTVEEESGPDLAVA